MTPEELKEFRWGLGLSQPQLAERLGCTDEYISQMERGVSPVSKRMQFKINRLKGETSERLLGNSN